MKKIIFQVALPFLIIPPIWAEFNLHLKPAENKICSHAMRGIDFVYLINLDERPEKHQNSIDQLEKYDIFPYRFSAVNGWKELTLQMINDIGVKWKDGMDSGFLATTYLENGDFSRVDELVGTRKDEAYFCHWMSLGAIGCTLSHLSVLKDAYDSGYKTIWILEDDIHVLKDPHLISDWIDRLDQLLGKNGWDILFTDKDIRDGKGNYVPCAGYARRPNYKPNDMQRLHINLTIDNNLRRVGARFGSHSMILRRSGIEKLLKFFFKYGVYHPYDMDYHAPPKMRMYTVLDDIVTNLVGAASDIRAPSYKNTKTGSL